MVKYRFVMKDFRFVKSLLGDLRLIANIAMWVLGEVAQVVLRCFGYGAEPLLPSLNTLGVCGRRRHLGNITQYLA